jgi:hypothetical protein
MISYWEEVLPAALKDLKPLHQELLTYIANLPGKRRPTYCHAQKTWSLNKKQFKDEVQAALAALRESLKRRGIYTVADLDTR